VKDWRTGTRAESGRYKRSRSLPNDSSRSRIAANRVPPAKQAPGEEAEAEPVRDVPGNDVMCQALRKLATVKMPSSASRWPNSRRLVGPQASPLARGLALVRPHPLSRRGGATVGADSKARRCRKLSLVPLGPWKRCTVRRDRWAHESARLRLSSPEVVGNPSSKTGLIRPHRSGLVKHKRETGRVASADFSAVWHRSVSLRFPKSRLTPAAGDWKSRVHVTDGPARFGLAGVPGGPA
jgi:hypothetical protein